MPELPMSHPDRPIFAQLKQLVLTEYEAALYLRLDDRREDDPASWIRALNRLVDDRHALKCLMYRPHRLYHIADLDDFLRHCRRRTPTTEI